MMWRVGVKILHTRFAQAHEVIEKYALSNFL